MERPTIRFKFNLNSKELKQKINKKYDSLGELVSEEWIDYILAIIPSDMALSEIFRQ